MPYITILDTSFTSINLGDYIIMDAVRKELDSLFPEDQFVTLPSHEVMWRTSYRRLKKSRLTFVGGTNLLNARINKNKQWYIGLKEAVLAKDLFILLGVGWWQYQQKPNRYTKFLLRRILSKDKLLSVRDSYTEKRLIEMGIHNVINTGCPTMWGLTADFCKDIPKVKSESVVFTITDYLREPKEDQFLIDTLLNNYKNVYFWPQGSEDLEYFAELTDDKAIQIIGPRLSSYDEILKNNDVDYIGTRLHAGVRAIQNKRRTIIIGVDNRAEEKRKDFNLKVIARQDLRECLTKEIGRSFTTDIKIPIDNINTWREQFKG